MKELINLTDLMHTQLRLMYDSEMRIAKFLPEVLKKVYSPRLVDLIDAYCEQQESVLGRLRQSFDLLFIQKRGGKSEVMIVMLKEMKNLVKSGAENEVVDAIIINALQHILHYQIAGYGAICSYANILDFDGVASSMHINLEEEKRMDSNLAIIAEETVNLNALNPKEIKIQL